MIGGAAYYGGKKRQQGQDREAEQEARLQDLESQQGAPASGGGGGLSEGAMDQLRQLSDLKKDGVLTDAEFEVQKEKILQGG